jgi:hypothetical protein
VKLGTHTRDVVVGAGPVGEQAVADLPRENGRTLAFVLGNPAHHRRRGDPGLGAPDGPGLDGAGLVVSARAKVCLY